MGRSRSTGARLPRWSRMQYEALWLAGPSLLGLLAYVTALALRLLRVL